MQEVVKVEDYTSADLPLLEELEELKVNEGSSLPKAPNKVVSISVEEWSHNSKGDF